MDVFVGRRQSLGGAGRGSWSMALGILGACQEPLMEAGMDSLSATGLAAWGWTMWDPEIAGDTSEHPYVVMGCSSRRR